MPRASDCGARAERPRLRYNYSFLINCFAEPAAGDEAPGIMPIYEYRCASCGHELEALQRLSDAPLTECPACHKPELQKLVSAAGFQLKGSGWYVTDFRNSGGKPAAKTGGAKTSDAAPAGAGGGDSGSAGKPESASDKGESGGAKSGDAKSGDGKPAAGPAATKAKAAGTTSGGNGGS